MSAIAERILGNTTLKGTLAGFSEDHRVLNKQFLNAIDHFRQPIWQSIRRDADVQEVHDEISSIAELEADWNGEEALPVSGDALRAARRMVDRIVQATKHYLVHWQAPSVAPTPEGGVTLTWEFAGRRLMLIIEGDDGDVVCIVKNGGMAPARYVVSTDHAIQGVVLTLSGW